jgi:hypothetical protein
MEDLVECGITDASGTSMLNERQREPLAHDRQMARAKETKRSFRHRRNVLGD